MIEVIVIENKVEEEEKSILLQDCDFGDVVELDSGAIAIVGIATSAAKQSFTDCGRCLLWFSGDASSFYLGEDYAQEAIRGSGSGAIKRIIGTLTKITVTEKGRE